jgi:SulP family sulfate permease
MVALPSSIAYGVAIYALLGPNVAPLGALAGILGLVTIGLVTSAFGGASRLISTPCAAATAVLTAFSFELIRSGTSVVQTLLLLTLLGLLAGVIQVLSGVLRLGLLIKYMPYTVVSGYLSSVGLIIIAGQLPRLLGTPKELQFWSALLSPGQWRWEAIVVGLVTIATMVGIPRIIRAVPPGILALLAGMLVFTGISLIDPSLLESKGNVLIVGALADAGAHAGFWDSLGLRWSVLETLDASRFQSLVVPAFTLAVLLSIDSLKACVMLDGATRSHHDPNRVLIGQGIANICSGAVGGIPGAGTLGATSVNLAGGGTSNYSGIVTGSLALLVFLVLTDLIAWVPVAALAGILMVVGFRMIDFGSFHFLNSRATILDFLVIAGVVATALTVSLVAASGVGLLLAAVLFVREQIGGAVVRRRLLGDEAFSKRVRTTSEMEILARHGNRAVTLELQGSLFFGTADQLSRAIEADIRMRDFVILDMRRVQTVDVTVVHLLEQAKESLAERNGFLIFSQIPEAMPPGRDLRKYFDQVGLSRPENLVRIFSTTDDAREWVEDRIIRDAQLADGEEVSLDLHEMELFKGQDKVSLSALESCMQKRFVPAGETLFSRGDRGGELFLIRRGAVRLVLPVSERQVHHLGTFGRGAFFGEMAFLDSETRSANAVAFSDCELYVLTRASFDAFAREHKMLALDLMEGIASVLASRLRYTNAEIRVLEA